MGRFESLEAGGTTARVYTAGAHEPGVPGVVVLHPWWGLNEDVIAFADRLAGEGLPSPRPTCSTAPWRRRSRTPSGWPVGRPGRRGVAVLATIDWLAERLGPDARLGLLGFSFGAWCGWSAADRDRWPRRSSTTAPSRASSPASPAPSSATSPRRTIRVGRGDPRDGGRAPRPAARRRSIAIREPATGSPSRRATPAVRTPSTWHSSARCVPAAAPGARRNPRRLARERRAVTESSARRRSTSRWHGGLAGPERRRLRLFRTASLRREPGLSPRSATCPTWTSTSWTWTPARRRDRAADHYRRRLPGDDPAGRRARRADLGARAQPGLSADPTAVQTYVIRARPSSPRRVLLAGGPRLRAQAGQP